MRFLVWSSIVKLQMDNNIIEKIEGLECLLNLEWLDLSFNNIEVIEGLDKLTKLKDLTLFRRVKIHLSLQWNGYYNGVQSYDSYIFMTRSCISTDGDESLAPPTA